MQGEVKAANEAQTQNTKVFLETLNRLSDKVRELQTKAETEDLRKQLASVQNDLQKTQKALAPAPKATLVFSFFPFINPPLGKGKTSAVTGKSLPLAPDGSVHVEFTILNNTDVTALDGEINLYICDDCKFAKEPPDFQRLSGQSDTQRYLSLESVLPRSWFRILTVDIIPPLYGGSMDIGFSFRCRTCVIPTESSKGTVHLLR